MITAAAAASVTKRIRDTLRVRACVSAVAGSKNPLLFSSSSRAQFCAVREVKKIGEDNGNLCAPR